MCNDKCGSSIRIRPLSQVSLLQRKRPQHTLLHARLSSSPMLSGLITRRSGRQKHGFTSDHRLRKVKPAKPPAGGTHLAASRHPGPGAVKGGEAVGLECFRVDGHLNYWAAPYPPAAGPHARTAPDLPGFAPLLTCWAGHPPRLAP
jgi:hypothetical protein